MKLFLKNPFTQWIKYSIKNLLIVLKYRKKHLFVGSNVKIWNCSFGNFVSIKDGASIGKSSFGDFTYIGFNTKVSRAKIGRFCYIGPDVKIGLGGKHPSNFVSTHPIFYSIQKQAQITFADKNYFEEYADIIIENDVWVGANALITEGVRIENGAIIAAGAVVTKDVPPYAVVGGVPAKIIKYRFEEDVIQKLLEDKWWEKDIYWLKENFKSFHTIDEYLKLITQL